MVRFIKFTGKAPAQVDTTGEPVYVCRCGLTRDEKGLCDGSHKKVEDEKEKKLYCYDENLDRKEIEKPKHKEGCGYC